MEPSLEYIVAKFPRFPFDKFTSASNALGTQMQATGEVMGIGSNLEEAKKAALDIGSPVVLRPAFTLGGTGGGFANNE